MVDAHFDQIGSVLIWYILCQIVIIVVTRTVCTSESTSCLNRDFCIPRYNVVVTPVYMYNIDISSAMNMINEKKDFKTKLSIKGTGPG